MAGFGGDRNRAIRMLEESAAYPSDVQADAAIILTLVYNREGRYDDALRVLEGLRQRFPRNRLLWLETGGTDMRAGRPARALEYLDTGIAMFEGDPDRRFRGRPLAPSGAWAPGRPGESLQRAGRRDPWVTGATPGNRKRVGETAPPNTAVAALAKRPPLAVRKPNAF
jgi:tetratricopeptide (TPR) repeat protein